MDERNRELTTTVVEDLKYFRDGWSPEVTNDTLRRTSASLRRLMVYRDYAKAWLAAGLAKQPSVIAIDLLIKVRGLGLDPSRCPFASAGGGSSHGITLLGSVMGRGGDARAIHEAAVRAPNPERAFMLSEYSESPELIVGGRQFSRDAVVNSPLKKCEFVTRRQSVHSASRNAPVDAPDS